METNAKKLLEQIPDWSDFMKLADEIKILSFSRMSVEARIKAKESDGFKIVMSDEKYFVSGKPVAVSYYDNAYKYPGLEGELLPIREEYARLSSELEQKRIQYEIYKQMLDVWRTVSANERSVV